MEENELEEGEACSGLEDDATVNPDIVLSYIDGKVQDVLGRFQKDFEGGICVDSLGPKYGEYGSFLPVHQRSPSNLLQPKSPQRSTNYSISRSPNNCQLEGACQNISISTSSSAPSKNNGTLIDSGNKNAHRSASAAPEAGHLLDFSNRQSNGNDPKTLKVRIKVGPDNVMARNNAAIYSGLGLDISPSSSPEDSPDDSGGLSPGADGAPESPFTMFQFYSCFHAPHLVTYLLSPISESLLHMVEKKMPYLKDCKMDDITGTKMVTDPPGKGKKSSEKNAKPSELKSLNSKEGGNDVSAILKNDIDIETPAGKEIFSKVLDLPFLSKYVDEKAELQFINEPVKGAGIPKGFDKAVGKERLVSPDLLHEPLDNTFAPKAGSRKIDNLPLKGKLNLKPSSADKLNQDLSTDFLNDDSTNGSLKAKKYSTDKNGDFIRSDSEGCRGRRDHLVRPEESAKLKSSQRNISHEQDEENILQGRDKSSRGKKKSKGSQSSDVPNLERKENPIAVPMVSSGEKKKSLAPKNERSEGKSNLVKPHKDSDRNLNRECLVSDTGFVKVGGVIRSDAFENISGNKLEELDHPRESLPLAEKAKEKIGSKKVENFLPPESFDKGLQHVPIGNSSASDIVPQPIPPVVIKENWVCCDKCQKWRLLPYGTDTVHLPENWRCSMLNWLPGMNKCNITEEETTRALHALYQLPASEGQVGAHGFRDASNSGKAFGDPHLRPSYGPGQHTFLSVAKKKPLIKDAFNGSSQPALALPINSSKGDQLTSTKSRSLGDVNEDPPESNFPNRTVSQHTNKPTNLVVEKQKHKHREKEKLLDQYSDGGDFNEQNGKKLKSMSRKEYSQDGQKAPKKIKTKASQNYDDSLSNHDLDGRTALSVVDGHSTKMSGKSILKKKSYLSSNNSSKEDPVVSGKKAKRSVEVTVNGEAMGQFSFLDAEKSSSAKKRKMKERQKNQALLLTGAQEETSDSVVRKGKKIKTSKTEGKELSTSKIDPKSERDHLMTGIPLSSSRDQLLNQVVENQGETGKVQQPSQRNTDGLDSLKRDFGYSQPSMATSSSSKVSGSHKSKTNFQEGRSSPVESVSSSPLRVSSIDKHPSRRISKGKDGAVNVGYFMSSPRRGSDGEVDGAYDQFGLNRKEKAVSAIHIGRLDSNRTAESRVLDPKLLGREVVRGKAKDLIFTTFFGGADDEPSPSEYEDANVGGDATFLSEQPNNYSSEYRGKNRDSDQEQRNNTCHANGLNTQKTSSKSSSRSQEKQKNDDYSRYGNVSHGRPTYYEDMRQEKCNVLEKEQKNSSSKIGGKRPSEDKKDSYSISGMRANAELNGSSTPVHKAKDLNSKVGESAIVSGDSKPRLQENLHAPLLREDEKHSAVVSGNSKPRLQENLRTPLPREDEKHSNRLLSDRADKPESIKGKPEPLSHVGSDKENPPNRGLQAVAVPFQGSRCETVSAEAGSGDAVNVLKQPRKSENQNGTLQGSLRNPRANGLAAHVAALPRRDGGQSDTNVLKEARDLKHKANSLKIEGLHNESSMLYFAAALKFLHVASLRETSNSENAKHGDMTPAIQMYSDTAKLCGFCAHEYEKLKEMAAAALAYKCMEVAYMKVVYFKSSVAVKDRHELQTAPQIGESPSSSASDVDNLNNHGVLEKAALGKSVNSPQIAGNHVIAARNRPNVARSLTFAQDVNFAMEASRRSLSAFASASSSVEDEKGAEGILSVRKVLDFGFHDIEALLRLVRLSIERISR